MNPRSQVGQAIAEAARTINQSQSFDETLQRIVDVARDALPGFDQVGISLLYADGKVETKAHSGELVPQLDDLQYSLREGPCVDTLRDAQVVPVPNLRHEQRWPRYIPEAARLGLRSQLALRLYLDGEGTIGGLNLYSTTADDIGSEAEATAPLFAAHAAIALGHAKTEEQLNEALQSRKVIGQATGILMERYDLTEDRAFAFLVRASSHGNVKLRDVAEEIVSSRGVL